MAEDIKSEHSAPIPVTRGDQIVPEKSQPSTEEPQAVSPNVVSSIDLVTRATATVLLFIYGAGFVILGFHDAHYGVVQFSPFRARIVLVGLVFTALVGLSVWALTARIAYWGVLKNVRADTAPERNWAKEFVLMCGFVLSANVIAQLLGFFMFASVSPERYSVWRWAVWVAVIVILLQVFDYVDKIFSEHSRRAGWVAIGAVSLYATALFALFPSAPWAQLAFFFVVVGLQAGLLKLSGHPRRHFSSLWSWLNLLCLVWIYITQIFSILPPRWGGGRPAPVQVFLNTSVPWSPSNPMDVLLLDETDQGIYVLLSTTGKAFFVPRSNIASVFFGPKDELNKKAGGSLLTH